MATKYPTRNKVKKAFQIGTVEHARANNKKAASVPLKYLPFKAKGKVYDRRGKR